MDQSIDNDAPMFDASKEFERGSPEAYLYNAIYFAKKDLRKRFPTQNPYIARDEDGQYILLGAMTALVNLMASVELNAVYERMAEDFNIDMSNADSAPPFEETFGDVPTRRS